MNKFSDYLQAKQQQVNEDISTADMEIELGRERTRMLFLVGQKVKDIAEDFRDIQALPDSPQKAKAIEGLMQEMFSRLNGLGVKL